MSNPRRNGSAASRMPGLLAAAAVAAAGAAALPMAAAAGQGAPGEPVTFTKDVAPILQRSCQQCHRPNSLAPMSLLSYEDARPWARSIKYRTGLRTQPGAMPPWYVEKDIGIQDYKNDPSLTDAEIATIAAWVDGGAPRGDPADMPPPLTFSAEDAWELGQPDLVLTTDSVEIAAGAPDWWGPFGEIPTGLAEDRYVAAVEMREINDLGGRLGGRTVGGRFVFHHLCWGTIAADGETRTRYPCHEVGRNADIFDPDAGRPLGVGSKAEIYSIHLHASSEDARAHVEIGFKLHPRGYEPTRPHSRMGLFGNSMNLDIRPLEDNQKFEAFTVLENNVRIVSFEPHMHAAGVRMCMDAIWGRTTQIETLSCVGYDHSWVRTYNFADHAAPLLPKGTILRMTGYFNNTPTNPNVSDPRNWSGLGHRSIDNMMNHLGEVIYLTDEQFRQEMAERRAALGLRQGQTVVGCPLCGADPAAMGGPGAVGDQGNDQQ